MNRMRVPRVLRPQAHGNAHVPGGPGGERRSTAVIHQPVVSPCTITGAAGAPGSTGELVRESVPRTPRRAGSRAAAAVGPRKARRVDAGGEEGPAAAAVS